MEKYNFNGKTVEEALETALNSLECNQDEIFYNELETKSGLFKSKKVEIEVIKKTDIINNIKEILTNLTNLMGINTQFEVKNRKDNVIITMVTESNTNNNILIGKRGRTINSLTLIIKQFIYNELGFNFNFILDVGDNKVKNQKRIESLAKKVAREVSKTKIEAKLDPMNSYERRIVHTILGENSLVRTESTGEEPNRCVVIKPKED